MSRPSSFNLANSSAHICVRNFFIFSTFYFHNYFFCGWWIYHIYFKDVFVSYFNTTQLILNFCLKNVLLREKFSLESLDKFPTSEYFAMPWQNIPLQVSGVIFTFSFENKTTHLSTMALTEEGKSPTVKTLGNRENFDSKFFSSLKQVLKKKLQFNFFFHFTL